MILVTGGSASGKSAFAERLAAGLPAEGLYYIAAMKPYGEEGRARVRRHRNMRSGKGFQTVERYLDVGGAPVPAGCTALLECLSNLLANEMFETGQQPDAAAAAERIWQGIGRLRERCGCLVIVSNEVFSDGVAYDRETAAYVKALGGLNTALAEEADAVYEVVYGVPVTLKERHPGKDS